MTQDRDTETTAEVAENNGALTQNPTLAYGVGVLFGAGIASGAHVTVAAAVGVFSIMVGVFINR